MSGVKPPSLRAASLFLLAAAVGALGGLAGHAFQWTIQAFQVFGLGDAPSGTIVEAARGLAVWQCVLVPAAGGLLAALLLRAIGDQRGPFGITDMIRLVITRAPDFGLRRSLVQILSSACSISSGSSIGKESANSQLGATAAAALGRLCRCSARDRAVLLGCGVAAGMAVSYNAPIAGALFVMEVVLGNFAMDVFAPVVVSAVVATLVTRQLAPLGDKALYAQGDVAAIHLTDPRLVLSAVVLGVICGAGGIGFRRMLEAGVLGFARLRLPLLWSMPLGGALVGVIGIAHPEVWGNGQQVVVGIIESAPGLHAPGLLLAIVLLKAVATAISTGSGALGGIFTPNLVVGAALGAVFAFPVEALVPPADVGLTSTQMRSGFALVGMAGLCAATAHAPITAVLLVFEFTRNYGLILPVMLCSILGSLVARLLDADSVFTARLRAHRHMLASGIEALAMHSNRVRDAMRADAARLLDTAGFEAVMDTFAGARRDTIYVVDGQGALQGHIHIHDVKFFINDPSLTSVVIAADLTRPARPVLPEQPLAEVLERFEDPDLDEVPVVRSANDATLIARLTRHDLIALLSDEVLGQRSLRAKLLPERDGRSSTVELPEGAVIARVKIPDQLLGRALDTLDLPAKARLTPLVVLRRDGAGKEQRTLPEPEVVLEAGWSLLVLGTRDAVEAFEKGGSGYPGS